MVLAKGFITGMVACSPNGLDVFAQFNGNNAVQADKEQSRSTEEPVVHLTSTLPVFGGCFHE